MFRSKSVRLGLSVVAVGLAQILFGFVFDWPIVAWLVSLVVVLLYSKLLLVKADWKNLLIKNLRVILWLSFMSLLTNIVLLIFGNYYVIFLPVLSLNLVGVGLLGWHELSSARSHRLEYIINALMIYASVTLSSLLLAYYHWPVGLVLILVWASQFLIALWWVSSFDHQPALMAIVWAMVVTEIVWVSSRWLSFYQLSKTGLILSQSSVLAISIGYSLSGLYYHRAHKKLTKPLIFEYFAITTIVFVLMIVMTKWSNLR